MKVSFFLSAFLAAETTLASNWFSKAGWFIFISSLHIQTDHIDSRGRSMSCYVVIYPRVKIIQQPRG